MAKTDPQVNVRIPADLKSLIEEAASASNRTVTAEVVSRLQQSFENNQAPPSDEAWHWEIKQRTSELRLETAQGHIRNVKMHGDLLRMRMQQMKTEKAPADAISELASAISDNAHELSLLQHQHRKLLDADFELNTQHANWNRPRLQQIDAAAAKLLQPDLGATHAAETRMDIPDDQRQVVKGPPTKHRQTAVPLVGSIGGDEAKVGETKTVAERLKEATKKSQQSFGRLG